MSQLPGKAIEPREGYYVVVLTAAEFHALPKRLYEWLRMYSSSNFTNGLHVWIEIHKSEMRAFLRVSEECANQTAAI